MEKNNLLRTEKAKAATKKEQALHTSKAVSKSEEEEEDEAEDERETDYGSVAENAKVRTQFKPALQKSKKAKVADEEEDQERKLEAEVPDDQDEDEHIDDAHGEVFHGEYAEKWEEVMKGVRTHRSDLVHDEVDQSETQEEEQGIDNVSDNVSEEGGLGDLMTSVDTNATVDDSPADDEGNLTEWQTDLRTGEPSSIDGADSNTSPGDGPPTAADAESASRVRVLNEPGEQQGGTVGSSSRVGKADSDAAASALGADPEKDSKSDLGDDVEHEGHAEHHDGVAEHAAHHDDDVEHHSNDADHVEHQGDDDERAVHHDDDGGHV